MIGCDIQIVEFSWQVGMPVCRPLGVGLWEVRSSFSGNRIAREILCMTEGEVNLLHSFIKKTQKTPQDDIALAASRKKEIDA